MRLRYSPCLFAVLAVVLIALPSSEPVQGCAVAPPRNQSVQIADETVLIVWDAPTKTQHFIRRASFKTEADNFGFLVPTPSKPELAEADGEVFSSLSRITAPKVVTQTKPSSSGCGFGCPGAASKGDNAPIANSVAVLDEKRVAGFDAAVLEADSVDALGKWLKDHDYPFAPALEEWVGYYVKAKWKVTAFKIAKPEKDAPKVGTSALRMSFQTERPFFPYREPSDQASGKNDFPPIRLLRVFLVSDKRTKGVLGDKDGAWPGKAVWSNHLPEDERKRLLELVKLPAAAPPAEWWLTEFEDDSSPRPGKEDLFFTASEDARPFERPPHIQYVSLSPPECVLCYALMACVALPLLGWRCRR
jgi:Uncharacterized protein conserved in bacteria (DUF2330)